MAPSVQDASPRLRKRNKLCVLASAAAAAANWTDSCSKAVACKPVATVGTRASLTHSLPHSHTHTLQSILSPCRLAPEILWNCRAARSLQPRQSARKFKRERVCCCCCSVVVVVVVVVMVVVASPKTDRSAVCSSGRRPPLVLSLSRVSPSLTHSHARVPSCCGEPRFLASFLLAPSSESVCFALVE